MTYQELLKRTRNREKPANKINGTNLPRGQELIAFTTRVHENFDFVGPSPGYKTLHF